jgi:flagellar basal-body rod protein FlgB
MFDVIRSDSALQLSRLALDGLALRQDVTSENIANVDTPGYKAKEVSFEQTLKEVMNGKPKNLNLVRTDPKHLDIPGSQILFKQTESRFGTPRADGNNVDIDREMVQMNETAIRQSAVTQWVARKLRLMKDITRVR